MFKLNGTVCTFAILTCSHRRITCQWRRCTRTKQSISITWHDLHHFWNTAKVSLYTLSFRTEFICFYKHPRISSFISNFSAPPGSYVVVECTYIPRSKFYRCCWHHVAACMSWLRVTSLQSTAVFSWCPATRAAACIATSGTAPEINRSDRKLATAASCRHYGNETT